MSFLASARGIPSFGDRAYLAPVSVATVVALPANTLSGTEILNANANGAFPTIDGILPGVGEPILVKNEATTDHNGIYILTDAGSAGTKWQLKRRKDCTELILNSPNSFGLCTEVIYGDVNANRIFIFNFDWLSVFHRPTNIPDAGTFTITGQGTATYTSKFQNIVRIGPIVVARIGWIVNAAGSGGTQLSCTTLALPAPLESGLWTGDRATVGAGRLFARFTALGFSDLMTISPTGVISGPLTGASLVNGAKYTLWMTYLSNAPE